MAPAPYKYKAEFEIPAVVPAPRPTGVMSSDLRVVSDQTDLGLPSASWHDGEFRVVVDVETDRGSSALPLALRVSDVPGRAGRYAISGTQYNLTLEFEIGPTDGKLHWRLDPSGRDARARAAVLDLLIAMNGRGIMTLTDDRAGALAKLTLEGGADVSDLKAERRFLTDVLVVEGWSNRRLPLPSELADDDAQALAKLAHWARTREMKVRFEGPITATVKPVDPLAEQVGPGDTLQLRLHEDVEEQLLGVWVPVGRLNYELDVTFERLDRDGVPWQAVFSTSEDWLTASIDAPDGEDSIARVTQADTGLIPTFAEPKPFHAKSRAKRNAQRFADALEIEPADSEILDRIRREWPA